LFSDFCSIKVAHRALTALCNNASKIVIIGKKGRMRREQLKSVVGNSANILVITRCEAIGYQL